MQLFVRYAFTIKMAVARAWVTMKVKPTALPYERGRYCVTVAIPFAFCLLKIALGTDCYEHVQ